jgi:hypothetical protein
MNTKNGSGPHNRLSYKALFFLLTQLFKQITAPFGYKSVYIMYDVKN